MGKKNCKKDGGAVDQGLKSRSLAKSPKKKVVSGILYVESTYNNTKVTLADKSGNVLIWSSSGALGFKGAKRALRLPRQK